MRRFLTTFLFLALVPAMTFAQSEKIAYVDVAYLVDNSPQAQAASDELQDRFGPQQEQLKQQQQDFKQLRQKLEKEGLVMSDSQRQEHRQRVQQLAREIQRGEKAFRDELNSQRNAALQQVREVVLSAVEAVATENEYDLVVGQGTVYASDAVNITSRVLERMKARFEASSD